MPCISFLNHIQKKLALLQVKFKVKFPYERKCYMRLFDMSISNSPYVTYRFISRNCYSQVTIQLRQASFLFDMFVKTVTLYFF